MAASSLLVIGKVWPEPSSSAAGKRLLQLIEIFQEDDYEVTFASSAKPSKYSIDLQELGISTKIIQLNDASFDEFISILNPDVVLYDRFMIEEQYGWRVSEHCSSALQLLDTEDLHFLREARRLAYGKNESLDTIDLDLINDITVRELASIYRCDLSLIISSHEMNVLVNSMGVDVDILHYVPFLVDWSQLNPIHEYPDYSQRQGFVSIGNFLHPPNLDSVRYLKKEIWPLIREKLPNEELTICGAYPTQEILDMHKPSEGFIVKGRVDDALEVVQEAKILLAPLRFGAGLKGKLLDALLTGTPSATTPIGVEGMAEHSKWPGVVAQDISLYVEQTVALYNDQVKWKKAQELIPDLLEKHFLDTKFKNNLVQRVEELRNSLYNHRKQNVFGQILKHQNNAASKYMSKWIEEKNKSKG